MVRKESILIKEKLTLKIYEEFLEQRETLIRNLEANKLTKSEYVEETYKFIQSLNLTPEEGPLSSCEEGLYNYQYFNMMAKYYQQNAQLLKYKDPFKAKDYRDLVDKYYKMKDKTTIRLLEYLNYTGVRGFYVHIKSKSLRGKLVEIVLEDYDLAVLHTLNDSIVKRLRKHKVFIEGQQKSVIDDYINTKYY